MVQKMALTDQTIIELFPLHIGDVEQGEQEVGRAETGVFISLPVEGVYLLSLLEKRLPLGNVKERFAQQYGQAPDLEDFLDGLASCGFIKKIDNQSIHHDESLPISSSPGWNVLAIIPYNAVAWLKCTPMLIFYGIIWLTTLLVFALHPSLFPLPAKALLLPSTLGNAVVLGLLGWIVVFLHELAHLFAARAYGCTSFLNISHRLYFLVAQTDMTSVRTLPRNQRYSPYLAGMTCDVTLFLICLLWELFRPSSSFPVALSYVILAGFLTQFAFFMRTDIYFVFTNFFRLGNLMQDSQHMLMNLLYSLLRRPQRYDLSSISHRELFFIRFYAIFYALGVIIASGEFIFLGLPLLWGFIHLATNNLAVGPKQAPFWDGIGFMVFMSLNFGLLFYSIWRDHMRRQVRQ